MDLTPFVEYLGAVGPIATVLGAAYRNYLKLEKQKKGLLMAIEGQGRANKEALESLEKAYATLNHNSTIVVRALLKAGILHNEDIKDVDLA